MKSEKWESCSLRRGMVSGRKLVRIRSGVGQVVIRSGHFGPYSVRGGAMNGPDSEIIFGKFVRQADLWL